MSDLNDAAVKARIDRRRLMLGTILGGGALTAVLLAPAAVQAADPPVARPVAAPTLSGMTRAPMDLVVRPLAAPAAPAADPAPQDLTVQDLTARPLQRLTAVIGGGAATYSYGDIVTTTNNTPGVSTTYAGATTITAGNITTSGDSSDGVSASNITAASPAPISITVGNVSTSGVNSNGVYARASGDLAITAGSVSTTGAMATGIYASATGDTVIKAGDITTSGAGVQAIGGGQISVAVGNVASGGTGISVMTGGNINISAASVTAATGTGISAYSSGGAVNINVGDVYATGGLRVVGVSAIGQNVTVTTGNVVGGLGGVYARAYNPYNVNDHSGAVNVTVNGEISVTGFLSHGVTADSDGAVNITTTGEISSTSLGMGFLHIPGAGIFAIGDGDVTINAEGRIKTYGPATGVFALSYTGDVTVNTSAINTYTGNSFGVRATAENGAATVVAGDITLSGPQSTGIVAVGGSVNYSTGYPVLQAGSVDVTLNGQIQAKANTSNGIVAVAYDGDVAVHNNGSITAGNIGGFGIRAAAYGTGSVVIDGQGTITTGDFGGGAGIVATTRDGSISITQGAVTSNEYGVLALAQATYGSNPANGIKINVGSVTTTGTGQAGSGIVAMDYNGGSTVTINAGSVTTIGDYANGVTATAFGTPTTSGTVTVTGGAISTRGKDAAGVVLVSSDIESVTLNSVATTGLGATALDLQSNPLATDGGINVNVGTISTAGDYALGVFAYHGTQTIQVGSVTTAGKQSLGVYASGTGDVTINAGSVATAGDQAIGILARSPTTASVTETGGITTQGDNASGVIAVAGQGPVDLTLTGTISTQGGGSAGAVGASDYGAVTVQAGKISTAGGGAPAVAVYAFGNSATVNIDSASTSGIKSPGVLVKGQTGAAFTANQITTSGADANALVIRSGGYGVIGNATVNVGSIATTGEHSAGVDAFTVGQSGSQASTLSINVGTITTTGIDSVGISAFNTYGAININASNISTQGAEAVGMLLFGGGDINIQAGSISTGAADAIYANGAGSGAITVGVTGKIASAAANGVVAINAAGATSITVGSGGGISGAADGVQIQTGTGQVTISNAGTISGGAGYAIDVSAQPQSQPQSAPTSGARIDNAGTVVGAVKLEAGVSNLFTNSGEFDATKDSDFGGTAQFVNTGVLKIAPGETAPGTVSFLNLTTFENTGGLVDLRNGRPGDVFTLSGDYVASGNARLGLDVGAGSADKLVVLGSASGATSILLGVNPGSATLLAKPLTLVQAGAGSTAVFTLANPDVGLIHYGLQQGSAASAATDGVRLAAAPAAPVTYSLTATAGAPVWGMLKLEQSAQTIWRQSADAWSEHLAAMRGDAWGAGPNASARSGRYWVQGYGSSGDRSDTVATGYGALSLDYNQTDAGVQVGADLLRTATRLGAVSWGVTGGYTGSHVDALGGALKSDVETLNFGGYGAFAHGPWFANALVKFDHHQFTTSDSVAGFSTSLNGNSYGAQVEAGRRYGSDRWAFEPVASLSYTRTSLGTASILDQSLAFADADGLSGKIGGRVLTHRSFNGTSAVFYAGASAADDFAGDQQLTFHSGGVSQNVSAGGEGAYGQAVVGVSATTARGLNLYLQGEAAFGGSHSGAGVRFGARF